ncbi:hypothetical protein DNTS_017630 [Danionella cerebrum]|uniref:Uncharacterized protein n=1 Tax=Danionella cerebrum TaxID=2873325 RepID=A0A553QUR2_9TELE|nr:hypothetical protein DNTS_017630 [Danionella translucida]
MPEEYKPYRIDRCERDFCSHSLVPAVKLLRKSRLKKFKSETALMIADVSSRIGFFTSAKHLRRNLDSQEGNCRPTTTRLRLSRGNSWSFHDTDVLQVVNAGGSDFLCATHIIPVKNEEGVVMMFILSFDYVLNEGSSDSLERLNNTSPARQESRFSSPHMPHSILSSFLIQSSLLTSLFLASLLFSVPSLSSHFILSSPCLLTSP